MANPTRDLSRVIHTAAPIVIGTNKCLKVNLVSYVAANIGYYAVLNMVTMTTSETIALVRPLPSLYYA